MSNLLGSPKAIIAALYFVFWVCLFASFAIKNYRDYQWKVVTDNYGPRSLQGRAIGYLVFSWVATWLVVLVVCHPDLVK